MNSKHDDNKVTDTPESTGVEQPSSTAPALDNRNCRTPIFQKKVLKDY